MDLSYCHEKLSEAVYELCLSTLSLKKKLRSRKILGFAALPEGAFPDSLREQFSEIAKALKGVRMGWDIENHPDAIDRMKPTEVRRLIEGIFHLHQCMEREYYRRSFGAHGEPQQR